jgi:ABC-type lipoprotein release transport system permease subunit
LGVPLLAALVPLYNATRVTILEAMTDLGIQATYGRSRVSRLIRRLPGPMAVRQSLNNVIQRRARLALSILALCLAATAFMGTLAVFLSVQEVITDIRARLQRDVQLQLSNVQDLNTIQSLLATEEQEVIRAIEPGVAVELRTEANQQEILVENSTDSLFVMGIDTQTDLDYLNLEEGAGWSDNPQRPGIVLTPGLADQFGKAVGDMMPLSTSTNSAEFEVIGIAAFPLEIGFMEWHQLADFVGFILDAPIPNAYWRRVAVEAADENGSVAGNEIWVLGIDEQFGRLLSPGYTSDRHGAILSQDLAARLGYMKDQDITLRVGEDTQAYPVLEVVTVDPNQLRLVATQIPEDLIGADGGVEVIALYWEDLATLENLDFNALSPTTVFIDIANPTPELDASLDSAPPRPVYNNQIAFTDRIASTISSVGLIFNLASLLMGAVGSIGLLTILSISVLERLREIGVMRSVGATSMTIAGQFLIEGLLVGLIAWIVGIPLSYLLSGRLIAIIPFSEVIPFTYPAIVPLIGLTGILILTTLASLGPAVNASRKTIAEILHYQ